MFSFAKQEDGWIGSTLSSKLGPEFRPPASQRTGLHFLCVVYTTINSSGGLSGRLVQLLPFSMHGSPAVSQVLGYVCLRHMNRGHCPPQHESFIQRINNMAQWVL